MTSRRAMENNLSALKRLRQETERGVCSVESGDIDRCIICNQWFKIEALCPVVIAGKAASVCVRCWHNIEIKTEEALSGITGSEAETGPGETAS